MPKKAKELPAYRVKKLTKPGLHAVGGVAGLHLQVTERGARSWILRVKIGDRRRDIGLGGYPDTTLEQARETAREYRHQVKQGLDPIEARRAKLDALRAETAKRITFDKAAAECHKSKAKEFKNAKHAAQWKSTLDTYASPVIGNLPVSEIELAHVVSVLTPIWETKTETATRVRQRIENVLAWATVSGYRKGDNPARWKGNLQHVLPAASKVRKKNHHPALPWQRIGEFMADLRGRDGMGAKALEFAILTASRSSEVRLAKWSEFDLDAKVWTVPAERMKANLPHRVPLSAPAIALLRTLPRWSDYVFPAAKGGPMSDMSISEVCRRMHEASVKAGGPGYLDPRQDRVAVPHGFRSSFKDWCRSATSYADEVSELALAHVNDDKTRAAYARDELLPKRARLMREWARFCWNHGSSASVSPIRGAV